MYFIVKDKGTILPAAHNVMRKTILFGVLLASSAVLFLASNMSTAEAASTNNWACTNIVKGYFVIAD